MKNLVLGCFAAVALMAAVPVPASAEDLQVNQPPAAASTEYNWTGFYVGGNAGYASGRTDAVPGTAGSTDPPVEFVPSSPGQPQSR